MNERIVTINLWNGTAIIHLTLQEWREVLANLELSTPEATANDGRRA